MSGSLGELATARIQSAHSSYEEDTALLSNQRGVEETQQRLRSGTTSPPGEQQPIMGSTGAPLSVADQELEDLRSWLHEAQKQQELNCLREVKARYKAGDLTAIPTAGSNLQLPLQTTGGLSASLPKPELPQRYSKRNRAEYNR